MLPHHLQDNHIRTQAYHHTRMQTFNRTAAPQPHTCPYARYSPTSATIALPYMCIRVQPYRHTATPTRVHISASAYMTHPLCSDAHFQRARCLTYLLQLGVARKCGCGDAVLSTGHK